MAKNDIALLFTPVNLEIILLHI